MAGVMVPTQQEGLMKLLQQISQTMTAPDANLEQLGALHQAVLGQLRQPIDTPVANSPVGAAQIPLSQGAAPQPAPAGPGAAMGSLSPMEQALLAAHLGGAQPPAAPPAAAPGSFPARGLMAGPGVPNMDEVTRMLHSAGRRA